MYKEISAKSWIELANLTLNKRRQKEREKVVYECIYIKLKCRQNHDGVRSPGVLLLLQGSEWGRTVVERGFWGALEEADHLLLFPWVVFR